MPKNPKRINDKLILNQWLLRLQIIINFVGLALGKIQKKRYFRFIINSSNFNIRLE